MRLFNKDKDLILKIVNLVFLVWLISAIAFFQVSIVDIIIPNQMENYEQYEELYCNNGEDTGLKDNCKTRYELEIKHYQDTKRRNKKTLFNSFGNVVIVSIAIFVLNKDR